MASLLRAYFTKAEVQQMLSYVNARDRDGWYYEPRKQFEKRHESIKNMLENLMVQGLSEPQTEERK